jgi:hypothetical protein
MERFPVELLYVLGFIAIVLFNFIAQRAARRRQQAEEAQAAPPPAQPAAPPPVEEEILEDIWGRTPAPAPARAPPLPVLAARPAAPPIAAQPPAPRRTHPVRALLHDRRDLRRAVVLMMVLGPCRSQEPPER